MLQGFYALNHLGPLSSSASGGSAALPYRTAALVRYQAYGLGGHRCSQRSLTFDPFRVGHSNEYRVVTYMTPKGSYIP